MLLSTTLQITLLKTQIHGQLRLFTRQAVLWLCIIAANSFPLVAGNLQADLPTHMSDDSDWWSYTRRPDLDVYDEKLSQKRELRASNFRILGVEVNDEVFEKASIKLGKVAVVQRGDGSAGRDQICYSSMGKQPRTYLVFEKGEMTNVFYLFDVGPDWNGSQLCRGSSLVTSHISTAAGLRLGLTKVQVKAILGKPSSSDDDKMIYELEAEKKTTAAEFETLKRRNPETGEAQLHEAYDSYSLNVYVEARFSSGKLTYLVISRTSAELP